MHQGRACYLDKWPGEEVFSLPVPIFNEEEPGSSPVNFEDKDLSLEGLFEELERIEEHYPNIPPFEALRTYFISPEVCPSSIIDPYLVYLIELEQAAREYHTLPYSGGLLDQPIALLDAFSAIRSARNEFDRVRLDKLREDAKKAGKGGTGKEIPGLRSPRGHLPPRTRNVD